ncbi:inositol monophosphatase family protein [Marivirga arenosa]|uniref:Inositol monophosphatase family protein n=1 Tax=Marivirga arenosa TaxID=3059076 RepID=A0AA49GKE7_9BACT|nr:inositol monophosphatase family protein [Marivirga sp. ABR2-2]WKK84344.2 inositol monophosphatase family protein [Marivirga sp. ABR2-2]
MNLTNHDMAELSKIAEKAAIEAGHYIQKQFDQQYEKRHKEGGDSLASQVVTEVDIQAQKIILDQLEESIIKYDLGLLTEEQEDNQSRFEKDYFWCVDPLDGTLAFTEGRSGYAVSIALISEAGDPIIACVYIPDSKELFSAILKKGLSLNGSPFKKSRSSDILHFYYDISLEKTPYFNTIKNELHNFAINNGLKNLKLHSGQGAVCNAIGVLKSGYGCYFKFPKENRGGGSIWDYAATRLIFNEAGLLVSTINGKKLPLNKENTFMNKFGIIYTFNSTIKKFILQLYKQLTK